MTNSTNETHARIDKLLETNKVVLFIKGTPQTPMCGFSARAVAILADLGVAFHSVNVFDDESIREGVKTYGNWPTIPQLYIKKQLIGGSDIMMEMYQSGELQEALKSI
jgi:monothiol glutaredoxin